MEQEIVSAPTAPLGNWSATVAFADKSNEAQLDFEDNGTVRLSSPVSTGEGTWTQTGDSRFSYRLKEVFNSIPGLPGWVDIEQDAVLTGETFTSSGDSNIWDVSGNPLATVTAHVSARREGAPE
ncbi:hypothetical protein ACEZCY_18440 [Streptacidiphilus sp. N1-12]|uniref:Uncharacterized protein n=2 Tax=Streptacidiphilus alkalitolerans TaxID=3342712 RepID=A0ABV6X8H5_9ACTN